MKLRFALFAVVEFWTHGLVRQADAAPVLPDMAVVALDEKVPYIVGQGIRSICVVEGPAPVL